LWIGVLAPAASARPVAGAVDRTWGTSGTVVAPVAPATMPNAVAVDGAHRTVAVSSRYDSNGIVSVVISRFLPNGARDTHFGNAGAVVLTFPGAVYPEAVAATADGRIAVAGVGYAEGPGVYWEMVRLRADGRPDVSFSTDGFAGPVPGEATAIAVDAQDRTLVAGRSYNGAILWRFTASGAVDPDFGYGGHVDTHPVKDSWADAIAIDAQGRIVTAGFTAESDGFLARTTTAGRRDTTFAGTGYRVVGGMRGFSSLTIDAAGNVVAPTQNSDGRMAIVRVRPDGNLDATFGHDGIATIPIAGSWSRGSAVAITPAGDLYVGGIGEITTSFEGPGPFALVAHVFSHGTIDRSFGCNGTAWLRFGLATSSGGNFVYRVDLDGRALLVTGVPLYTGSGIGMTRLRLDLTKPAGYRLATAGGDVDAFGGAAPCASLAYTPLDHPVVGITGTPAGGGYWAVTDDGGVYAFGDARFRGSTGLLRLHAPIVGMAATPTGNGYWLVASDGGVFAFGDARFHGSAGALKLHALIVGMTASATGNGYWLVASDGGVFAFGDARFHGSTGALKLHAPVVGVTASATGNGYWLVASDGGVFAFGDARFHGSTGALALQSPVVGMAANATGHGYWLAAADGGVFAFGDAPFLGADARVPANTPFVGIAAAR
jgi:uncharacterized delta-60 repeat protein